MKGAVARFHIYVGIQRKLILIRGDDELYSKALVYLTSLLADISPPYGQYANPDKIDENSIFAASPTNIPQRLRYNDLVNLVDESGKLDTLFRADGTFVIPSDMVSPEFISNFKDSWADSLLHLHPEYCKLALYESNPSFTSSHDWDIQFQNIKTYQEAKDNGFLNPLGYIGVVAQPSTVIRDPFFDNSINPVYANTWRGIMNDSMNRKAKYTGGNFLDMWSLATAMAQCDTGATACYIHYSGNQYPFDIDTSCRGTLDLAWKYFQQMYIAEKTEIINKILGQACDAGINIDESQHILNFPDNTKLNPLAAGSVQAGTDSLNNLINRSCAGYVTQWWNELAPCNYTPADSVIIFPRLIKVCEEGGDIDHPFGASTVKPSSGNAYRSFAEVIDAYNDSLRTAGTPRDLAATACNAYILSAPGSYANRPSYSPQEIWTKPDSCMCSTIGYLYQQYQLYGHGDTNFSAYLYRTSNTVISNAAIDSLRNLCSGTITCKFLTSPIVVPPVLQCGVRDVCASCSMISAAYAKFQTAFPTTTPSYDNSDSSQRAKNTLFEKFMNYQLGFGKLGFEYLQFMDSCHLHYPFTHSDSLLQVVNDYRKASETINAFTPHYDASGCDTTTLKVDLGGITYNLGVTLGDCIHDGMLQLPKHIIDSVVQSGSTRGIDYDWVKAPLCTDTAGFTFEVNMKISDSAARDYFYPQAWFWANPDYDPSIAIPPLDSIKPIGTVLAAVNNNPANGGGFCTHQNDISKSCLTLFPALHSLADWTNIKLKFIGSQCLYYINDTLIYTATLSKPVSKLYYWGMNSWSLYTAVDFVRIYNNNGGMLYDEEFNGGCSMLAYPTTLATQCSPDCTLPFATYFNTVQHTSYTYSQVDSLYSSWGIVLSPCTDSGITLCGRSEPIFPPVTLRQYSPCDDSTNFTVTTATMQFNVYKDSLYNTFNDKYLAKCLSAYKAESFTVTQPMSEFHYTLYYYDQAGSLVRTVPPEGVDMTVFSRTTYFDSVKAARANGTVYKPKHQFKTNYRYNSLNQVIAQTTPDAGLSSFWYDRLGRLVISQNARQKAASGGENNRPYSFTGYDYLGRINEVGQVVNDTTGGNGPMTDAVSRNDSSFTAWMLKLTNRKEQVTRTYYDLAYPYTNTITLNAVNLRNRVAYTTLTNGNSTTDYNAATFYSYDLHGNVDTLLQDFGLSTSMATANIMNRNANRWLRIVYKYDLISGKVNQVAYNVKYYSVVLRSWVTPLNQFYHRYSYDAENRLTMVETSRDSVIWEKDARYEYYKHGPLARMLIGDQQVQGLDYAYTLQGWLKGVNSTSTTTATDMGEDGKTGGQNINIGRDIVGYNLNYFAGDYASINNNYNPFPGTSAYLGTGYRPLYNGNISSMAVNIKPLNKPYLYNYKYDQLNRLTGMDAFTGLDTTGNNWSALTPTKSWNERVSYDGNGNINKYTRYFDVTSTPMDSLTYNYISGTNKLSSVRDRSQGWVNGNYKIKNQVTNNYAYDEIGDLIKDSSEYIPTGGIKWNVYGKITEINHSQAGVLFNTKRINYYYDASGNRIGKRIVKFGTPNVTYTWYVRDAQGNVMQVYTAAKDTLASDTTDAKRLTRLSSNDLIWAESHIYGSSRLGVQNQILPAEQNNQGSVYYNERGKKFYDMRSIRQRKKNN